MIVASHLVGVYLCVIAANRLIYLLFGTWRLGSGGRPGADVHVGGADDLDQVVSFGTLILG